MFGWLILVLSLRLNCCVYGDCLSPRILTMDVFIANILDVQENEQTKDLLSLSILTVMLLPSC